MPKKVNPDILARWRRLQAEGKSYAQIARLTEWQARTVRKHLQADIRLEEGQAIRRELFKELLGQHWEMLIESIVKGLEALESLPPHELAVLVSEPETQDLTMGGSASSVLARGTARQL